MEEEEEEFEEEEEEEDDDDVPESVILQNHLKHLHNTANVRETTAEYEDESGDVYALADSSDEDKGVHRQHHDRNRGLGEKVEDGRIDNPFSGINDLYQLYNIELSPQKEHISDSDEDDNSDTVQKRKASATEGLYDCIDEGDISEESEEEACTSKHRRPTPYIVSPPQPKNNFSGMDERSPSNTSWTIAVGKTVDVTCTSPNDLQGILKKHHNLQQQQRMKKSLRFNLHNNDTEHTYHPAEYTRSSWFDMEQAMEDWEDEEDDERRRQLEDRWRTFEQDLPQGCKCNERVHYEQETAKLAFLTRRAQNKARSERVDVTFQLLTFLQAADRLYNDLLAGTIDVGGHPAQSIKCNSPTMDANKNTQVDVEVVHNNRNNNNNNSPSSSRHSSSDSDHKTSTTNDSNGLLPQSSFQQKHTQLIPMQKLSQQPINKRLVATREMNNFLNAPSVTPSTTSTATYSSSSCSASKVQASASLFNSLFEESDQSSVSTISNGTITRKSPTGSSSEQNNTSSWSPSRKEYELAMLNEKEQRERERVVAHEIERKKRQRERKRSLLRQGNNSEVSTRASYESIGSHSTNTTDKPSLLSALTSLDEIGRQDELQSDVYMSVDEDVNHQNQTNNDVYMVIGDDETKGLKLLASQNDSGDVDDKAVEDEDAESVCDVSSIEGSKVDKQPKKKKKNKAAKMIRSSLRRLSGKKKRSKSSPPPSDSSLHSKLNCSLESVASSSSNNTSSVSPPSSISSSSQFTPTKLQQQQQQHLSPSSDDGDLSPSRKSLKKKGKLSDLIRLFERKDNTSRSSISKNSDDVEDNGNGVGKRDSKSSFAKRSFKKMFSSMKKGKKIRESTSSINKLDDTTTASQDSNSGVRNSPLAVTSTYHNDPSNTSRSSCPTVSTTSTDSSEIQYYKKVNKGRMSLPNNSNVLSLSRPPSSRRATGTLGQPRSPRGYSSKVQSMRAQFEQQSQQQQRERELNAFYNQHQYNQSQQQQQQQPNEASFLSVPTNAPTGSDWSLNSDITPISSGMQVRALYTYSGTQGDELSFEEGDVITVTEAEDADGWLKGTHDQTQQTGKFPGNYVMSA
eukprot:m.121165 g.121165  ORF g.121165 m.121165 type:complete len:1077 (-) comp12920_c3_seq1:1656-4886(-)